jgi:putative transposase
MATKKDPIEKQSQPLLQIQISVPDARRAMGAFAQDRKAALRAFTAAVRETAANALNGLLNAEIGLFLDAPGQAGNKRNGYRVREYALKGVGNVQLRLPRDRDGAFDSVILPNHERMDPALREDIAFLHLAGLSNRMLGMISRRILGIEVSKDLVSTSVSSISEAALSWLTRPISGKYWALYIDGTNFRVQRRGSTEKEPSLVVLGVDDKQRRSILAIEPGARDNVDAWRAVFRELHKRGLSSEDVRIGVMDGLPGLEKLFREEFPNAVTARCWIHALRNAYAKTPKRFVDAFKRMAQDVMYAESENDAREAFKRLKTAMGADAQRAIACLERDLDSLLVHYRFDKRFRIALKTTNGIERIHKELKRRTKVMESIGEDKLMVTVAFVAMRMEMGWMNHRVDSQAVAALTAPARRTRQSSDALENIVDTLTTTH